MAHHNIEETFRAVNSRQRGSSSAPSISVGVSSMGDGFSSSLSQAAQEISQLRSVYQAQADLIAANTQALNKSGGSSGGQGNSGSSGGGVGAGLESAAQHVFGSGILGILPLIGGIASLFGGGKSEPAPLPVYTAPPSIAIDSTLRNGVGAGYSSQRDGAAQTLMSDRLRQMDSVATLANASGASNWSDSSLTAAREMNQGVGNPASTNGVTGKQPSFSPQVTVNIQAMDSQSFLDRSNDIASAVREAVLNLHPLTSVLADL